jgi:hypothetical protein
VHKGEDEDEDEDEEDDDDDDDTETLSSLTYPFLTIRYLSPDRITTNLHVVLSLSYSFLLIAGCCRVPQMFSPTV